MNFLELVQRAVKESGAHLDIPQSLSNLDGLQLLFRDWVAEAWREIQMERTDWDFNKVNESFAISLASLPSPHVVIEQGTLPNVPDNKVILEQKVYVVDPSDPDDQPSIVIYIPWRQWEHMYPTDKSQLEWQLANRPAGRPSRYTIMPDGAILLNSRPDKEYSLCYWQNLGLQELEADADVPDRLREDLHMIIVWKTLMEYGLYHDDRSVFERARMKFRPLKKYMERESLPNMTMVTDVLYRR